MFSNEINHRVGTSDENRYSLAKSESGAISFQGVLTLVVVVLIVWGAISFLPMVSVPNQLEENVIETCKDFLRMSTPQKANKGNRSRAIKDIRQTVEESLKGHTWEPKDLEIKLMGNERIKVSLPYTLNLNIIGFVMNVDKKLDVTQQSVHF